VIEGRHHSCLKITVRMHKAKQNFNKHLSGWKETYFELVLTCIIILLSQTEWLGYNYFFLRTRAIYLHTVFTCMRRPSKANSTSYTNIWISGLYTGIQIYSASGKGVHLFLCQQITKVCQEGFRVLQSQCGHATALSQLDKVNLIWT
jgi:hypothetical protein